MGTADLIWLLLIAIVVGYWLDAMRSNEVARNIGRKACTQANVLFLDDSVALTKVRVGRNTSGQFNLYRCYRFEFTSDGSQRYNGTIVLFGKQLEQVQLDAYRIPEEQNYS